MRTLRIIRFAKAFLKDEAGGLLRRSVFRIGALALMASASAGVVSARYSTGICNMQCETQNACQTLTGPKKIGVWFAMEGKCDFYDCWSNTYDLEIIDALAMGMSEDQLSYYFQHCEDDDEFCYNQHSITGDRRIDGSPKATTMSGSKTFANMGYLEHQNAITMDSAESAQQSEIVATHHHAINPACPGQGVVWVGRTTFSGGTDDNDRVALSCMCYATDSEETVAQHYCGKGASAWAEWLEGASDYWWLSVLFAALGMPPSIWATSLGASMTPTGDVTPGSIDPSFVSVHTGRLTYDIQDVSDSRSDCDDDVMTETEFLDAIFGVS